MSSALEQIRHLIRDDKDTKPAFKDETLLDFLLLNDQNIYAAAADALRAWAVDITLVLRKVEMTNYNIDAPSMAKILLMAAESMEARARDRTIGKPPQVGIL